MRCKINNNLGKQTDEAEIKAEMRPQRVRDAGNRMERQAAKWTADGRGERLRLSTPRRGCGPLSKPGRGAYVSCRGYVGIL